MTEGFDDHRPAEWTEDWFPAPRWGTRRRPERETHGGAAALMARKLGTPYLPAQRHLMDVALEIDSESGLYAYSTVVCLLHRQFGKTMVLVLSKKLAKARLFPGLSMVYTAQDRNHAREKFEEDFVERIRESGAFTEGRNGDFTVRLANGSERLRMRNGSVIKIAATKSSSGHGKTLDDADVDEAWTHEDTTVDSGFRVPMITRRSVPPGPQLWIVSAAGIEDESTYLEDKVKVGRAAVERDSGKGMAYFEWSCPPEWDEGLRDDPSRWWHFVPALGHTIREEDLVQEMEEMSWDDWMRAYACRFAPSKAQVAGGIDMDDWEGQLDEESRIDPTTEIVLGLDGSPDRAWGSIGVAGWREDGSAHVEVVKTKGGTGWLGRRAITLAKRHGAKVAIDPASTAGAHIDALEAAGVEVITINARDHAQACGKVYDRIEEGTLFHLGQDSLDVAVDEAQWRTLGDAQAWDRKSASANITPLVAVTMALGGLEAEAAEPEKYPESVYDDLVGFGEW